MKKPGDIYRACASVVVLRPADVCGPEGCGTIYQVLLVHKPRKKDAWQIPQGGVEKNETTEHAAKRELEEEAGITVEVIGQSACVYQYDFPESYRRFRPDNVCGQRIEYVFATVDRDVQVTVDEKEIDAFVWALPEELDRYIKRKEYLKIVQDLVKEGVALIEE